MTPLQICAATSCSIAGILYVLRDAPDHTCSCTEVTTQSSWHSDSHHTTKPALQLLPLNLWAALLWKLISALVVRQTVVWWLVQVSLYAYVVSTGIHLCLLPSWLRSPAGACAPHSLSSAALATGRPSAAAAPRHLSSHRSAPQDRHTYMPAWEVCSPA